MHGFFRDILNKTWQIESWIQYHFLGTYNDQFCGTVVHFREYFWETTTIFWCLSKKIKQKFEVL